MPEYCDINFLLLIKFLSLFKVELLNPIRFKKNSYSPGATVKRKSIDAVPIWFVSKRIKPEKCITGDTLAPEKKAPMITGDARGSQHVKSMCRLFGDQH